MGLNLIKNKGEILRVWYARLTRNGRKIDVRLDTAPVRGTIPLTASGNWDRNAKGDDAFERSRAEAERAFDELVRKSAKQRRKVAKLKDEIKVLTGQAVGQTPLTALFKKWSSLKREKPPTKLRCAFAEATFSGFASFAATFSQANGTVCTNLEEISADMAAAYFEKLRSTYAWETVKAKYSLLRNAWRKWSLATGGNNPFEGVIVRKGEDNTGRVSRIPLTGEEARRLFEIVQENDPSLYPLLTAAATTGLRLGDAVSLTWDEVKIEHDSAKRKTGLYGIVDTRTRKTGARIIVPIIQPFASVVLEMDAKRDARDVYLFPEHRDRYLNKNTRAGLSSEIKPFFALAVAKNQHYSENEAEEPKTEDEIVAAIANAHFQPQKQERLVSVIHAKFSGATQKQIGETLGLAPALVSQSLRDVEALTGVTLRDSPMSRREGKLGKTKRQLADETKAERSVGRLRASLYGWHSLRATYVVLGIEAGIPMAYIEKAVGHATVSMTLQYFNPTGKHAAAVMAKALSNVFSDQLTASPCIEVTPPATPTPQPTLEEQIDALDEEARKAIARRILGL